MRFQRATRHPFTDTPRKRAALARKQRLEREALPLFAADVAAEQEHPDTIMADRALRWARETVANRKHLASQWRAARRRLNTYPPRERAALRAYWQRCSWPGTAVYLLSMLHMFDTGRLDAVHQELGRAP